MENSLPGRWRGCPDLGSAVPNPAHHLPLWQAEAFEGTIADWFTLLQDNPLIGLLSLELGIVIGYVLLIPVLVALYVALKRASEFLAAIALSTGLVGAAAYFPANTAFDMLALSDRYAAASTDAERAALEAVGETMLISVYKEGTAFIVSYFLVSVAIIAISVPMLWSDLFGKVAGYVGIVSSVAGFGIFLPFGPVLYGGALIGEYIAILSVVGLMIWNILIALGLFRLVHDQATFRGTDRCS